MVSAVQPRAIVYVDGFNLYRGCLEGSPYKWLDLEALCTRLLPERSIKRIRYFTAHIKDDVARSARQNIYLRAIRSLQTVVVHDDGTFLVNTVIRPVADEPHPKMQAVLEWYSPPYWQALTRPAIGHYLRASVKHTVEKGSDVNLAAYLMFDAFRKEMDEALIISGDSDLATPIRLVRQHFVPVGVVNPTLNETSRKLLKAADSYSMLIRAGLAACQLPNTVVDKTGQSLQKPGTW